MKNAKLLMACVIFLLPFTAGMAQQQNWWPFGQGAAIDFSSGGPVPTTSGLNHNEGTASVCGTNGLLLFYTNGIKAYRSNHTLMADAGGSTAYTMSGNSSSAQTLIVPRPGTNLYYIFTVPPGGTEKVKYSVVDMTSGTGTVTIVNNAMPGTGGFDSERMCAVKHCNGVDFWLITHEANNRVFKVYLISNSGISSPTAYTTGNASAPGTFGCMKASRSGKWLAITFSANAGVELFPFNPSTGNVGGATSINSGQYQHYGLEFSGNNQYLFFHALGSGIYRYDINTGSLVIAVPAPSTTPGTAIYGQMQIAPDFNIYIARPNYNYISRLTNPNAGGTFVETAVTLSGGTFSGLGLPNFPVYNNPTCSNASFYFNNLNQVTTQVSTSYGMQTSTSVCLPNVYINGSASSNENNYHLKIEPLTLSPWATGAPLYSNWICTTSCTVPGQIDLSAYASFTPGQYYLVTLSVGPEWHSVSQILFARQCPQSTAHFSLIDAEAPYTAGTPFGTEQVYPMCLPTIQINGSLSSYETNYYLKVSRFDLGSWTFLPNASTHLVDGWQCSSACNAPSVIDLSGLPFVANNVYRVELSVGPNWNSYVRFIKPISCTHSGQMEFEDVSPDASTASFSVFPNPGNGAFTIQLSGEGSTNIVVLNMMGQVVAEQNSVTAANTTLNLTEQPAGVYLVKVVTGDHTQVKRIIKN